MEIRRTITGLSQRIWSLAISVLLVATILPVSVPSAHAARDGEYKGSDPIVRSCRDRYQDDVAFCEAVRNSRYERCYREYDSCEGDGCRAELEECLSGADENYDRCVENAKNERLCCEGHMEFCR